MSREDKKEMPAFKMYLTAALAAIMGAVVGMALAVAVVTPTARPAQPASVVDTVELTAGKVAKVLPFMTHKCKKITSNGCFWRDTNGEPPNLSFYAIPMNTKKCVTYWYHPEWRFCTSPNAKAAPPPASVTDAVVFRSEFARFTLAGRPLRPQRRRPAGSGASVPACIACAH